MLIYVRRHYKYSFVIIAVGVIPGRGVPAILGEDKRRLTFMVGFWKSIAARDRGLDSPGPGQAMPNLSLTKYTWPLEMSLLHSSEDDLVSPKDQDVKSPIVSETCDYPVFVSPIWEAIEAPDGSKKSKNMQDITALSEPPHYRTCFQGF